MVYFSYFYGRKKFFLHSKFSWLHWKTSRTVDMFLDVFINGKSLRKIGCANRRVYPNLWQYIYVIFIHIICILLTGLQFSSRSFIIWLIENKIFTSKGYWVLVNKSHFLFNGWHCYIRGILAENNNSYTNFVDNSYMSNFLQIIFKTNTNIIFTKNPFYLL